MKILLIISLLFAPALCVAQAISDGQTTRKITYAGGNVVQFSEDSTMRVQSGHFTYLDQLCDISTSLQPTPAWTQEVYCSTGLPLVFLRHDQDDYFFAKIQFNHNKALGTALADMHIHCIPMSNGNGDVYFTVYYKWINYGETLPIDTAIGAGTWTRTAATLPIVAGDQYKEGVCILLSNISAPANETPSSILHVIAIRRGSTSALDTYTTNKTCGGTNSANFGVTYIDAHYKVNKMGSKTSTTD